MGTERTSKLAQLQRACERTLKDYLRACREGYGLLSAIEASPISEEQRAHILAQRRREIDAHTAYTMARTKLWSFLTRPTEVEEPETPEPNGVDVDPESTLPV